LNACISTAIFFIGMLTGGAVKCLLLHLGNYLCMNRSAKIMSLCSDCSLCILVWGVGTGYFGRLIC